MPLIPPLSLNDELGATPNLPGPVSASEENATSPTLNSPLNFVLPAERAYHQSKREKNFIGAARYMTSIEEFNLYFYKVLSSNSSTMVDLDILDFLIINGYEKYHIDLLYMHCMSREFGLDQRTQARLASAHIDFHKALMNAPKKDHYLYREAIALYYQLLQKEASAQQVIDHLYAFQTDCRAIDELKAFMCVKSGDNNMLAHVLEGYRYPKKTKLWSLSLEYAIRQQDNPCVHLLLRSGVPPTAAHYDQALALQNHFKAQNNASAFETSASICNVISLYLRVVQSTAPITPTTVPYSRHSPSNPPTSFSIPHTHVPPKRTRPPTPSKLPTPIEPPLEALPMPLEGILPRAPQALLFTKVTPGELQPKKTTRTSKIYPMTALSSHARETSKRRALEYPGPVKMALLPERTRNASEDNKKRPGKRIK